MTTPNPFIRESLGDLGTSDIGGNKDSVDSMIKQAVYSTDKVCLVCGNPAKFRIVAKNSMVNTAEIQDRGFICEHCLSTGSISKVDFGIREL